MRLSTFARLAALIVLGTSAAPCQTNWVRRSTPPFIAGHPLAGIAALNANLAVLVGDSGLLASTLDGGKTWDPIATTFRGDMNGIVIPSATRAVAVGGVLPLIAGFSSGEVLRSGAAGWAEQQIPRDYFNAVAFSADSIGIACGFQERMVGPSDLWRGIIDRTTDGGANWDSVMIPTRAEMVAVTFATRAVGFAVGFAVGDSGRILKSIDTGLTWSRAADVGNHFLDAIAFANPDTAIIVGDEGLIFRSLDGGATWNPATSGVGADVELNDVAFAGPRIAYAVGTSGVVLRSTDAGATWTRETMPDTLWRYGIAAIDSAHAIIVADSGAVYTLEPGTPGGVQETAPSAVGLIAYPNPAGESVRVTTESNGSIELIDALGRRLSSRETEAGIETMFDLSGCAPGVVFARMSRTGAVLPIMVRR